MKFIHFLTFLCFSSISLTGYSQRQDFNQYETLRSKGPIPEDFNTSTFSKIEKDLLVRRENFTEEEQRDFTERIHNSVDELLQSGKVTFGDEISQYVSNVAKNLLKDDPELFAKLRFYTVKSNITNALSTDQGVIFVTTGLISQLASEAELAYVLSHEIVHFTEKHAMEWFEFSRDEDVIDKMQEMSIYSQEKEFEADAKGIELYLKAGYSKEHLTVLFDVLAYSYLPIDEIPFPDDYFNTAICEIPKKKFSNEKFNIKLDENYDDRRSTHPNIKRRKTKALETADTLLNWGDKTNVLSLAEFEYIRNVARFERLRSDMLDKQYDQAIYTILILEKKFPNSIYLTRMKSQAWYGMAVNKANDRDEIFDFDFFQENDEFGFEGEIATLQLFLKKMTAIETSTLAARILQDNKNKFPEDKEINVLWERTMKQLMFTRNFEFEKYSTVPYAEYLVKAKLEADSLKSSKITEQEFARMNKYQKIRNKRKVADKIAILDSTNYYLYNISDIVSDSQFVELYRKNKDKSPEFYFEDYSEGYYDYEEYDLTRKERRILKKERKRNDNSEIENGEPIPLSEIIIIDPYIAHYEDNEMNTQMSVELEKTFNAAILEIVKARNLTASTIGRGNLNQMTTEQFNQKCIYLTLLNQLNQYNGANAFPVDYTELVALEEQKENRKVVFVALIDNYEEEQYDYFERKTLRSKIKKWFNKDNKASIYMIILDPKNQELLLQEQRSFKKGKTKNEIRQQVEKLLNTRIEVEFDESDETFTEEIIEE